MMDFRLKTVITGHRGLNMGLCPGPYDGVRSIEECINVAESAFGFLEPAITSNCPKYSGYAHYGVTAISKEDWSRILDEWESLRKTLEVSRGFEVLRHLRFLDKDAKKDFLSNVERNRMRLVRMIGELSDWLRIQLATHPVATVLGI
jgi:hypothetical protein